MSVNYISGISANYISGIQGLYYKPITFQEYKLVGSWGLEEAQLAKCNINAIKVETDNTVCNLEIPSKLFQASFLPEGEKELMVKRLFAAYGLDST